MIFAHTADWHLGKSRFLSDYLDRQISGIRAVYDDAIRRGIKVVVAAGDITDNKQLTNRERDALIEIVSEYDRKGIITLIAAGNHDIAEESSYTHLRPLITLIKDGRLPHTVVAEISPLLHVVDNVWFLLVPYQGVGSGRELIDLIQAFVDHVPLGAPLVIVAHEYVLNYVTDLGWKNDPTKDPNARGIDMSSTTRELPNVTYFAFGDIHKMQQIAPNAWFCGSPIEHNFGETRPKGYLIVDTDHPTTPEFVPLEAAKPIITLTEVPQVWPNAHIRLQLKKDIELDQTKLPPSVYHVDWVDTEQVRTVKVGPDLLDGLEPFLSNLGTLSVNEIPKAVDLAQEIRTAVGV